MLFMSLLSKLICQMRSHPVVLFHVSEDSLNLKSLCAVRAMINLYFIHKDIFFLAAIPIITYGRANTQQPMAHCHLDFSSQKE